MIDRLNSDPESPVRLVSGADAICVACPHLDRGQCKRFGPQVNDIDEKVISRLGYFTGDTETWSSLLESVRDRIDPSRLFEYCGECRWRDLSYCSDGIAALSAEKPAGD